MDPDPAVFLHRDPAVFLMWIQIQLIQLKKKPYEEFSVVEKNRFSVFPPGSGSTCLGIAFRVEHLVKPTI